MRLGKLLFFVGLALVTGFVGGGKIFHLDLPQHYLDPEIPIGQYDQAV